MELIGSVTLVIVALGIILSSPMINGLMRNMMILAQRTTCTPASHVLLAHSRARQTCKMTLLVHLALPSLKAQQKVLIQINLASR